MSSNILQNCSQRPIILAVTGTNGKSSTVWFTRQLLESAGLTAMSFGTFGIVSSAGCSPDPWCLPGRAGADVLLDNMKAQGADVIVWEAFSSSLAAGVLDELNVSAAALTTLSRDHLDGHRTWARYVSAKEHLFRHVLPNGGTAVLSADTPEGVHFRSIATQRQQEVVTFGRAPGAEVQLFEERPTSGGTWLDIDVGSARYRGVVPVVGAMMVDNVLAAIALARSAGIEVAALMEGLSELVSPPGRVEHVATIHGASVFVDYAHTPAALASVLQSLRVRTKGRLHLVFGCGGDRDRGKRAEMGSLATSLADVVFVTDDNPRHEDPARIRAEVLRTCPKGKEVGDRYNAIERALAGLSPGDTLVVAGKGHESVQYVAGEDRPFSDTRVVVDIVSRSSPAPTEIATSKKWSENVQTLADATR